jgi:hypothetical protein
VGVNDGLQAEVRMYDHLFTDAQPCRPQPRQPESSDRVCGAITGPRACRCALSV